MKNKTVIIIQARLNSLRFPRKILEKIGNKTLIEILISRLKLCQKIDEIVLVKLTDERFEFDFRVVLSRKCFIIVFEVFTSPVILFIFKQLKEILLR